MEDRSRLLWTSIGPCHSRATTVSTHDFHPRFACLSRLLKYLGGHLKSLNLFKTQHNVAEKAGVGGSTPPLAIIFSIIWKVSLNYLVRSKSAESWVEGQSHQFDPYAGSDAQSNI
jgi:hypothetical protein